MKKFLTEEKRRTNGEPISRKNALGEAQKQVTITILNSCTTSALTEKFALVLQNTQTTDVLHLSREEAKRIGVGVLVPRLTKTPMEPRKFRTSDPGHRQGEEAVVSARQ
jgi:hypothetical protein